MKEFEIWMEGYAATGESSDAQFIGKIMAETFNEACEKLRPGELDKNEDGTYRYKTPSIWARHLYDNETDARKAFG